MTSRMVNPFQKVYNLKKKNDFVEGERKEGKRETNLLFHLFMGWFLYVPWLGIKPAALAYQYNASAR